VKGVKTVEAESVMEMPQHSLSEGHLLDSSGVKKQENVEKNFEN
jgi:hypothetical protein